MAIIIKFNKEKIKKDFSEGKIKAYAIEKGLSEVGALAYLYFFNYVSISADMQRKDSGRAMYVEFAKGLERMIRDYCEIEWENDIREIKAVENE
jgi:hypothetical protein